MLCDLGLLRLRAVQLRGCRLNAGLLTVGLATGKHRKTWGLGSGLIGADIG